MSTLIRVLTDCPPDPADKYVRGDILCGGYAIEPHANFPDRCTLHYVAHVDTKGSIPSAIVKSVQAKQPMIVATMRRHLEARRAANRAPERVRCINSAC